MEVSAGPELDSMLQAKVFGDRSGSDSVPPFSTRDWTALALAELVADRKG